MSKCNAGSNMKVFERNARRIDIVENECVYVINCDTSLILLPFHCFLFLTSLPSVDPITSVHKIDPLPFSLLPSSLHTVAICYRADHSWRLWLRHVRLSTTLARFQCPS